LFYTDEGQWCVSEEEATPDELRTLHKTIKKVAEDIEKLSFNTSVSTFMVCVNELGSYKCSKRSILEPLTVVLSSFAPHIAEELWQALGHKTSIAFETYPSFNPAYLEESTYECPVSVNGKVRAKIMLDKDKTQSELEAIILPHPDIVKWMEGKPVKKIIVVPNRMVNIVV
jgi:leucyl-tRNA synthetase